MLRIILGVIVGFVVWSILWLGSDGLFASFSSGWYGAQKDAMVLAVENGQSFRADMTVVLIDLARSVVASIMAGFLAAMAAGENRRSPFILGVILLAIGIAVQIHAWNVYPAWFHIVFWILLIPMTVLGGKMKQTA